MDNNKLKEFWQDKPKEDAEHAFDTALNVIMVIEFVVTVGLYMVLKTYASQFWAECWMVLAYVFVLKQNFDLLSSKLKDDVLERLGYGKQEKTEDNDKEKPKGKDIST